MFCSISDCFLCSGQYLNDFSPIVTLVNFRMKFHPCSIRMINCSVRMMAYFQRKSYGKFEKWKVNPILINWIQTRQTDHEISDVVCAKFENLMKKINSKLT